jgi:hypothetical protein
MYVEISKNRILLSYAIPLLQTRLCVFAAFCHGFKNMIGPDCVHSWGDGGAKPNNPYLRKRVLFDTKGLGDLPSMQLCPAPRAPSTDTMLPFETWSAPRGDLLSKLGWRGCSGLTPASSSLERMLLRSARC